MPATAVVLLLGLIIFWLGLAGRLNFLLLSWWLGPSSAQSFDGPVPRVRVEIFSDGVYAAAATGLMIELLSGLLKEGAHGGSGGQSDEERQSVWPGLVNYLYCFHVRMSRPRSAACINLRLLVQHRYIHQHDTTLGIVLYNIDRGSPASLASEHRRQDPRLQPAAPGH